MKIKWFAHASFLVEGDGLRLCDAIRHHTPQGRKEAALPPGHRLRL